MPDMESVKQVSESTAAHLENLTQEAGVEEDVLGLLNR